jgi:hypothetical protein
MSTLNELDIPDGVTEAKDATELIRFWVANGEDFVSLRPGVFAPEHEPGHWGMIIADIAKHAVRAMTQNDPSLNTEDLFREIEDGFMGRLEAVANYTGNIKRRLS